MDINQVLASMNNAYVQGVAFVAVCLTVFNRVKVIATNIALFLQPLVEEVEKLAQDGKIDKEDRKVVVMQAVKELQDKGVIKLNPITKFFAGIVCDKIAERLPDFYITKASETIIQEAANGLGKLTKQPS